MEIRRAKKPEARQSYVIVTWSLSCEQGLKTLNGGAFKDSFGSCGDPRACLHVPCVLSSRRFMQMEGGVTVKAGTLVLSGRLSPYVWSTIFPEHPLYCYPVSTPRLFLQLHLCFANKLVNSQQPLARAIVLSIPPSSCREGAFTQGLNLGKREQIYWRGIQYWQIDRV